MSMKVQRELGTVRSWRNTWGFIKRDDNGKGGKMAKLATLPQVPSFVEDTTAKTGLSERTVQQAIHRAEAIAPEVREQIRDMPLHSPAQAGGDCNCSVE